MRWWSFNLGQGLLQTFTLSLIVMSLFTKLLCFSICLPDPGLHSHPNHPIPPRLNLTPTLHSHRVLGPPGRSLPLYQHIQPPHGFIHPPVHDRSTSQKIQIPDCPPPLSTPIPYCVFLSNCRLILDY